MEKDYIEVDYKTYRNFKRDSKLCWVFAIGFVISTGFGIYCAKTPITVTKTEYIPIAGPVITNTNINLAVEELQEIQRYEAMSSEEWCSKRGKACFKWECDGIANKKAFLQEKFDTFNQHYQVMR